MQGKIPFFAHKVCRKGDEVFFWFLLFAPAVGRDYECVAIRSLGREVIFWNPWN